MSSLPLTRHFQTICDSDPYFSKNPQKVLDFLQNCKNRDQLKLTTELLTRFFNVSEDIKYEAYQSIVSHVKSLGDNGKRLVIAAMTFDGSADSGQQVLNEIKTEFFIAGIREFREANLIPHLWKKEKNRKPQKWRYSEVSRLVIVDQFIGSGQTVVNRINEVKKNRPDITAISVCVIAAMAEGVATIRAAHPDVDLFTYRTLSKGISSGYPEPEALTHMLTMFEMEGLLRSNDGIKQLSGYSFGYGQSEALISFCRGNIPNNVFPWFWWRFDNNGNSRNPLFTRYEAGFQ